MAPHIVQLPKWFNEKRYTCKPPNEAALREAALAVLDRVPFYQAVMGRGFDAERLDEGKRKKALSILEEWSANPYQRPDECSRMTLYACLTSTIRMADSSDVVEVFTAVLEREDARNDEASQEQEAYQRRELETLLKDSLGQLKQTAVHPSEVRQKLIMALSLPEMEEEQIDPSGPAWIGKLLDYYVAAYMDLMLWAALEGIHLGKSIHGKVSALQQVLCLGNSDPRQVVRLLKDFQDEKLLPYLVRIEEGGIIEAIVKNQKRRKT
ncbi:hypothetical protein ACPF7Z_03870 [Halomonas sp. GXIMD04776]|uniref:hypothetical protein n=1 Tax=Halomonas sp. GXIMD04776 TaxID=3415605 RepID=UPI003C803E36